MNRIQILLIAFFLIFQHARCQQIDYKGFPQWSWHKEGNTEYYLYAPSDTIPEQRHPAAIFLHGCCGQDDHATLRNAVDPPARMWHNFGANTQMEPTYIIAPKTTRGWSQKFADIKKAVDDLVAAGKVDPRRIYMTGFSMGGAGTWQFLEQYPGYIAAAIPMGMGITANLEKIRNIPSWTIRGEFDYYAQKLDSQVAVVRKLNGYDGGGMEWITGVNPMFTSFEGVGHGVQWDAASSLDLLGWAYTQVNDGNISPVVYFTAPEHKQVFSPGQEIQLEIHADDDDGRVSSIQLKLNHRLISTFSESPVLEKIKIREGDNLIEAVAMDDEGKLSLARIIVRTNTKPIITTCELPDGKTGAFYRKELFASGNEPLRFAMPGNSSLPKGLRLENGNVITGIPEVDGDFTVNLAVIDGDLDKTEASFSFHIWEKDPGEVLVSNVHSTSDTLINRVSKMMAGELPNTQSGTEVSFSNTGPYTGLTYISTSADMADISSDALLNFHIDEDATIYVAYEKLDHLFTSSVPEWLLGFERVYGSQIVAQYHYFNVYKKDYPAGDISLPGGESTKNNVVRPYFVMFAKRGVSLNTVPEITTGNLPKIYAGIPYVERLTSLGGEGKITWRIIGGNLPEGLKLSPDGMISGMYNGKGKFAVEIKAEDLQGDSGIIKIELNFDGQGTGHFKVIHYIH
jgi:pimeloyl-ACP methyl ester carboxylesterase